MQVCNYHFQHQKLTESPYAALTCFPTSTMPHLTDSAKSPKSPQALSPKSQMSICAKSLQCALKSPSQHPPPPNSNRVRQLLSACACRPARARVHAPRPAPARCSPRAARPRSAAPCRAGTTSSAPRRRRCRLPWPWRGWRAQNGAPGRGAPEQDTSGRMPHNVIETQGRERVYLNPWTFL